MALVIFAVTVWLYWPSTHGELLSVDDLEYLRQSVRWNGLTWNAVKWAFTTTQPYYHPLPRLSHVLDYQIWKKNAAGHHATSVVVHALNAALVFGFLWTLLGAAALTTGERLATAASVATVFAIHPLQVESVAWISGRTQLLCTTFGITCLWAYVAGARRWVVWVLLALALLCKPMAVSFPFVMLAIDYFPLRRHEQLGWGRLLREKAASIALAGAVAAATMISKSLARGLMHSLETISLSQHMLLVFRSLAFYPWKLVWPAHLSTYYPLRLGLSLDQWPVLASVLFVGMITTLAVWYRRRLPALAAAWGAYLMLLLPVSGLLQTSWETTAPTAPRYAYVAILPLLLLAGAATVWLWRRSATVIRVATACLLTGELYIFGTCTQKLILIWRNDEMVWRTALAQFPDWQLPNRLFTRALLGQGRGREALECARRYVQIAPQQYESHNTLGLVLAEVGRPQDAVAQYEEASRIRPDYAEAHFNLAAAMSKLGDPQNAIRQ
jgi:hypothetical protein